MENLEDEEDSTSIANPGEGRVPTKAIIAVSVFIALVVTLIPCAYLCCYGCKKLNINPFGCIQRGAGPDDIENLVRDSNEDVEVDHYLEHATTTGLSYESGLNCLSSSSVQSLTSSSSFQSISECHQETVRGNGDELNDNAAAVCTNGSESLLSEPEEEVHTEPTLPRQEEPIFTIAIREEPRWDLKERTVGISGLLDYNDNVYNQEQQQEYLGGIITLRDETTSLSVADFNHPRLDPLPDGTTILPENVDKLDEFLSPTSNTLPILQPILNNISARSVVVLAGPVLSSLTTSAIPTSTFSLNNSSAPTASISSSAASSTIASTPTTTNSSPNLKVLTSTLSLPESASTSSTTSLTFVCHSQTFNPTTSSSKSAPLKKSPVAHHESPKNDLLTTTTSRNLAFLERRKDSLPLSYTGSHPPCKLFSYEYSYRIDEKLMNLYIQISERLKEGIESVRWEWEMAWGGCDFSDLLWSCRFPRLVIEMILEGFLMCNCYSSLSPLLLPLKRFIASSYEEHIEVGIQYLQKIQRGLGPEKKDISINLAQQLILNVNNPNDYYFRTGLIIGVDATPNCFGGYCVNLRERRIEFYSMRSTDIPWKSDRGNCSKEFEMKNVLFALCLWSKEIVTAKKFSIYTDNFAIIESHHRGRAVKYGRRAFNLIKHFQDCENACLVNSNVYVNRVKDLKSFAINIQPADALSRHRFDSCVTFLSMFYGIDHTNIKGTHQLKNIGCGGSRLNSIKKGQTPFYYEALEKVNSFVCNLDCEHQNTVRNNDLKISKETFNQNPNDLDKNAKANQSPTSATVCN